MTSIKSRAERTPRRRALARAGAAVAASGTVAGALLLAAPAFAATHHATTATTYTFTTLNDQADPTFNQLLGINGNHVIAGYFGSGADAQHPNKGYVLRPPYGQANYTNENFPGSTQTQVTGLNNQGDTSGFWVTANGTNHGFVLTNPQGPKSHWQSIDDPNGIGSTVVNGINGAGDLVGFYTDAAGNTDGMLATP